MVRMRLQFYALLVGTFVMLLTQSCIMGQSRWEILQGNLAFSRGDYHQATLHYLDALKDSTEHQDWIRYNLGNVYHSLGETEASSRMWKKTETSQDQELLFAVLFNQGVAAYEAGKYRDALAVFRRALNLNPKHHGVKVNLELTQQKIGTSRAETPSSGSTQTAPPKTEDNARVLDYVRLKEERFWLSLRKDQVDAGENDW